MSNNYRDYGAFAGQTPQQVSITAPRGQVYQATHKGENRLPLMNRSFISFSFGGRWIEDYNLIATISGDRLERDGYSSFDSNTTTNDGLDGQELWGTHYRTNTFNFHLSTDGIDQKMFDDFLYWFRAGEVRELVLAEHPNRAQLARVSEPPRISLLPFQTTTTITISNETYPVTTTLYKGDIDITLVTDQPHWYSLTNILGKKDEERERYVDTWVDNTKNPPEEVSIFASQDALKILYEDGIPLGSMILANMLLGNGAFANIDQGSEKSKIWSISEIEIDFESNGTGARIEANDATYPYQNGFIAGAIISATGNGIESLGTYTGDTSNVGHFFYSGTAPAPLTISFTIETPQFNNGYISAPENSYTNPSKPYNTITIESEHKHELRITTPNLLTSYNKVIDIFTNAGSKTVEDLRVELRENVRHARVREWANKVLDGAPGNRITNMQYMFKDTSSNWYPMTFSFNSETGEAVGTFKYRTIGGTATQETDWSAYGTIPSNTVEEDIGDMLLTNYILIIDRNYPTDGGNIVGWDGETIQGKRYSHRVYHDINTSIKNLSILYKNMYL